MSIRKINMYSTTGKVDKSGYESKATTTEELRKELQDLGIDLTNKSVTEFHNQKELVAGQDLPEGDLQLYILPAAVKSGKSYE